ncbi:MAG: GTPase domain-containing protein [Phycisphaerae bacterium]|nr:GTPase domain-containing protein [Phycisphaerae bacterium]
MSTFPTATGAIAEPVGPAPGAECAPTGPAAELARINAELAALMNCRQVDLVSGADRSLGDPLVICGILGGKDVGKSTLINALAGRRVSAGHEEVGLGTTRPMAYIHRDSIAAYRRRFAGVNELIDKLDVTEHDADPLHNVVLVDLPDFDSDLPQHLATVQAVGTLLDRLIWVVTPRKIADRDWVSLFSTVVKDGQNVHCVLNKADELLGDDAYASGLPATFMLEQTDWARGIIARAGCPHDHDHLFILAAEAPTPDAFVQHVARRWGDPEWSAYGADRDAVATIGRQLAGEVHRLRECVLTPVTRSDAESLKAANQRVEIRHNVEAIRRHFELDEWARRLRRACDAEYHQGLLNDVFGAGFCDIVDRRLRTGQRSETELADDLLVGRVEQWPILPIIFWPMRWLVRRLGARFAGSRWAPHDPAEDAFTVRGQTLVDRLRVYRARIDGDHAQTIRRFQLASRLPGVEPMAQRISSRAATLVAELDEDLLVSLNQAYGRPAVWKRWLLWAMLIWFPLAQPLAVGLLKLAGAGGEIDRLGGALQIVVALGATHLLTGLVFVAFVYVIVLAAMYARCVGQVRRARRHTGGETEVDNGGQIVDRVDDLLVSEIIGGVSRPFAEIEQTLSDLLQRLERLGDSPRG